AGYSGTPLWKKLGIKGGSAVALVGAPEGFDGLLEGAPGDAVVKRDPRGGGFDVIVAFFVRERDLSRRFAALRGRMKVDGGLWIAWPKRASGVETDLTEDVVRAIGLEAGVVDNKVCAVDDVWSGLRFVVRVKDR